MADSENYTWQELREIAEKLVYTSGRARRVIEDAMSDLSARIQDVPAPKIAETLFTEQGRWLAIQQRQIDDQSSLLLDVLLKLDNHIPE